MTSRPIVTIGMPVYNASAHINEAIESLLEQSFSDFELVIADNSSTDETVDFIENWAENDSRIRCFKHGANLGAAANFEFVLKQAKGEYFMWAAADDRWDKLWIEKIIKGFDHHDISVAFGKVIAVTENGEIFRDCGEYSFSDNSLLRLVKYYLMDDYSGKACLIYGLYKTPFLQQRKPFNRYAAGAFSDMLFVFSYMRYGNAYIDPSTVFYKRMPNLSSIKRSFIKKMLDSLLSIDRISYYIGYVTESHGFFHKFVMLSLLPIKYIKDLFTNGLRAINR